MIEFTMILPRLPTRWTLALPFTWTRWLRRHHQGDLIIQGQDIIPSAQDRCVLGLCGGRRLDADSVVCLQDHNSGL